MEFDHFSHPEHLGGEGGRGHTQGPLFNFHKGGGNLFLRAKKVKLDH